VADNIYEKCVHVNEQDADIPYVRLVEVDVLTQDAAIIDAEDVEVEFDLEVVTSKSGIDDIICEITKIGEIPYTRQSPDEDQKQVLIVDVEKLEVIWEAGASFGPTFLTLYLDQDNELDYSRSAITVSYIDKA